MILASREDIERLLTHARCIAVLGAHHERHRPAFYVPDWMHRMGSRIVPVNPMLLGQSIWGEPVRASLAEIRDAVDVVDVFRRSEDLAAHLADILAMAPRPGAVWLQSGIEDAAFAARLTDEGIDVVQDRCMYEDHRTLGLGRTPGT